MTERRDWVLVQEGIEHVANAHATKLHTASVTLTKTKMEDILNICDMKNLVSCSSTKPQTGILRSNGIIYSLKCSSTRFICNGCTTCSSRRCFHEPTIDTFSREMMDVTISPTNLIEMRFPTTGKVGENIGDFRPTDSFEGYGGDSFDARDREPLGGISRAEDLDNNKGGF